VGTYDVSVGPRWGPGASMFNKHKRILWLLNHRTLMPYECALIRRLGFEVFVPKVIPDGSFRSGFVDYSHDSSLSIPTRVLERLNTFNFYENVWPSEIVGMVNRYFGSAFVMAYGVQFEEAVDNFEGQIVLRAFGLLGDQTYGEVLEVLYGSRIRRKLSEIGSRFWFGEGYDNLHEIEKPAFAARSLFLPLGIPERLWLRADEWRQTDNSILFLCPNIVSTPYYADMYAGFKREFGDLPHRIVGAQDVPVDDPHVTGFVSDEELERLYLSCSVLYYPSMEPRHVHYFPIEAMIKGMPVVYFEGSLMDRLCGRASSGRAASACEARTIVERVLDGDADLVSKIRHDQRGVFSHFTDAFCYEMWKRQMEERGFNAALAGRSRRRIMRDEVVRTVLKPVARGKTRIDPHRGTRRLETTRMSAEQAAVEVGSTIADGIDFSSPTLPNHVNEISGLHRPEEWGRWSSGDRVAISLKHTLNGEFRLFVQAVGYGQNAGAFVRVKIGSQTRMLRLPGHNDDHLGSSLHFKMRKPSNIVQFHVPYPTAVSAGGRTVGMGLVRIAALPPVVLDEEAARARFGQSAADGIDFTRPGLPDFVEAVEGISTIEPWGRRSTARLIRIELRHVLQGNFRLFIQGFRMGAAAATSIPIRIGSQTRNWDAPASIEARSCSCLDYNLKTPSNVIEIVVPRRNRGSSGAESEGVGLVRLFTAPPVALDQSEAAVALGRSLADGIDFSACDLPDFVTAFTGLSEAEPWGRWSIGKNVTISLEHVLVGEFRLFVRAVGYGRNAGSSMSVRVGSQRRTALLPNGADPGPGAYLQFDLKKPASVIDIAVGHATQPPSDNRVLGVGLVALALAAPVTISEAEAKAVIGGSFGDGIDFSASELPAFVDAFDGLSAAESWGRWSIGRQVAIELKHTLEGSFRLGLRVCGYGPNVGAWLKVKIGRQVRQIALPAELASDDELFLDFDLRERSNRITLVVPYPIVPPNDTRTLGVGLIWMRSLSRG
jgi:hypothetical protein